MLKLLVDLKADLSPWFQFQGGLQMKLLHVACRNADVEMVEYILKQEKNPGAAIAEVVVPTKSSVTHLAAQGGKVKVMEYLVRSGADPCLMNDERDTPLHISIRHGHEDFSRHLI